MWLVLSTLKGAFATTTATATRTSLENVTLGNFYYFAIFPTRSTCTLWAKNTGTKFMETVFTQGRKWKIQRRVLTFWSFHVVVLLVTAKKCTILVATLENCHVNLLFRESGSTTPPLGTWLNFRKSNRRTLQRRRNWRLCWSCAGT